MYFVVIPINCNSVKYILNVSMKKNLIHCLWLRLEVSTIKERSFQIWRPRFNVLVCCRLYRNIVPISILANSSKKDLCNFNNRILNSSPYTTRNKKQHWLFLLLWIDIAFIIYIHFSLLLEQNCTPSGFASFKLPNSISISRYQHCVNVWCIAWHPRFVGFPAKSPKINSC